MDAAAFAEQFLPEVTVDVALLSIASDGRLCTLLAQRTEEPFNGRWALPGVFVGRNETLEGAASRALRTKAGITRVFLEQLFTFGDLKRDPRGRILSVAYYALVPEARFAHALERGTASAVAYLDIAAAEGEPVSTVAVRDAEGKRLKLAFDHDRIIALAVQRIRGKLDYAPIGFELLPAEFTLLELQQIHEAVLGRELNKDSFRRRMLASGLVEDTGRRRTGTSFRPALLYRFKPQESRHG